MSLATIYSLMILAIIAAIFALEFNRLLFSVIGLIVMNLLVWIVLLSLNALLVAWIQLIVYGGGFTALFVVVMALTEKQRDESFDWKRTTIGAVTIAIVIGLSIWAIVSSEGLFTESGTNTIIDSLGYLWTERLMDFILQAVVFFVTSVGIGVMFLQYKKKKSEKEVKT